MDIFLLILKAIGVLILASIALAIIMAVLMAMGILIEETIRIIKERKGGKK